MSAFRDGLDRHNLMARDIQVRRLSPDRIRLSIEGDEHEFTASEAAEIGAALAESTGLLVSTHAVIEELVARKQEIERLLDMEPRFLVKKP
jgi:hypothetical protein